jgi:hypothetical protein
MTKTVDSYRFTSGITRRMIKSWIKMEKPRAIPGSYPACYRGKYLNEHSKEPRCDNNRRQ